MSELSGRVAEVLAGDQRQPGVILVLEERLDGRWRDQAALADFIHVNEAVVVDVDLLPEFEVGQVCEGSRLAVRVGYVTGQDGVARPGRVGGAFEIPGVAAQPGDIPRVVLELNADDRQVETDGRNLQSQFACRVLR